MVVRKDCRVWIVLDEFTEWFAKGEADGLFTSILDPMTQTATRMAQMLEGHY